MKKALFYFLFCVFMYFVLKQVVWKILVYKKNLKMIYFMLLATGGISGRSIVILESI